MRQRLIGSLLAAFVFYAAGAAAQEAPTAPLPPPAPPPPGQQADPQPPMPPMPPHGWGPHGWDPHHPPMLLHTHVNVTVDSGPEKNAVLEERTKTDEVRGQEAYVIPLRSEVQTWEQVCVAPCSVQLDRRTMYRVGGENGVTQSSRFTLPPGTDPIKLEVEPGNYWWHHFGTRLSAIGSVALIVGGAFVASASSWDDKDSEKNVRIGGLISAGVGLVLLGVGIPMSLVTRTHVKANDRKVAGPHLGPTGLVF